MVPKNTALAASALGASLEWLMAQGLWGLLSSPAALTAPAASGHGPGPAAVVSPLDSSRK